MKLFHIECFITEKHLHDTMTYLEGVSARNVAVRTVKDAQDNKPRAGTKKPTRKGSIIEVLKEHFDDKANVTKKELLESGITGRHMGVLCRYGYLTKLKSGDYAVKHLEAAA